MTMIMIRLWVGVLPRVTVFVCGFVLSEMRGWVENFHV
jgi:hypothetical protein